MTQPDKAPEKTPAPSPKTVEKDKGEKTVLSGGSGVKITKDGRRVLTDTVHPDEKLLGEENEEDK